MAAATNAPREDEIPKLIPPRGEIPPTFWEQKGGWMIVAAVVVLGVIVFTAWWLTRPKPAVVIPPEVIARKALEPLRGKAEDGAVLSQISQIIRHYVSAAFGLPPGEMTTADFCRAIAEQGRLGAELSTTLSAFLRKCDERKFAPSEPGQPVAAGILPPGGGRESGATSTADKMPAATAQGGVPGLEVVAQALKLIELTEARRAQLPPIQEVRPATRAPRAYRGASKG